MPTHKQTQRRTETHRPGSALGLQFRSIPIGVPSAFFFAFCVSGVSSRALIPVAPDALAAGDPPLPVALDLPRCGDATAEPVVFAFPVAVAAVGIVVALEVVVFAFIPVNSFGLRRFAGGNFRTRLPAGD